MADTNQSQQLERVLAAMNDRSTSPDLAKDMVSDIKNTLPSQLKWEHLVMTAPVALSVTGAVYMATSSSDGRMNLSQPDGGFRYLNFPSLGPSLMTCGELGRKAFADIEVNLGNISQVSENAAKLIGDALGFLLDASGALQMKYTAEKLKSAADLCQKRAKGSYDSLDTCLLTALEIFTACSKLRGSPEDATIQAQLDTEMTTLSVTSSETTSKVANLTTEVMKSMMDKVANTFQKASEINPSGCDLLTQQIVSGMVGAVAGLLSSKMSESTGQPDSKTNKAGKGTPSVIDAGRCQIQKDMAYYDILNAVINKGKDGGIDWESVSQDRGSNITTFAATMLTESLSSFGTSDQEISARYKEALIVIEKIARELADEGKNFTKISYSPPGANDSRVQSWKSAFTEKYRTIVELNAFAKSQSGCATYPAPLADHDIGDLEKPKAGTLAQSFIDVAKNQYETAQKIIQGNSKNYAESIKLVSEAQEALDTVKSRVSDITNSWMKLAEVNRVLLAFIRLMMNTQDTISKLVRCFAGLSSCITFLHDTQITPFIDTVTKDMDKASQMKVGKVSKVDFQRLCVFNSLMVVRAYFSTLCDIAKIYTQLSRDSIRPGVELLSRLGIEPEERAYQQLKQWSEFASKSIQNAVNQKQQQVQEDMEDKVRSIGEITRNLPVSDQVKKAIENGTNRALQMQAAANAEAGKAVVSNLTSF